MEKEQQVPHVTQNQPFSEYKEKHLRDYHVPPVQLELANTLKEKGIISDAERDEFNTLISSLQNSIFLLNQKNFNVVVPLEKIFFDSRYFKAFCQLLSEKGFISYRKEKSKIIATWEHRQRTTVYPALAKKIIDKKWVNYDETQIREVTRILLKFFGEKKTSIDKKLQYADKEKFNEEKVKLFDFLDIINESNINSNGLNASPRIITNFF